MRTLLLVTLGLLMTTVAMAQPLSAVVTGTVINSINATPLAGVKVEVEASGTVKLLLHPTDTAGRFTFDPLKLFNAWERDTQGLTVHLSKPGFDAVVQVVSFERRGQWPPTLPTVQLVALPSTARLTEVEKANLAPFISGDGRTLYLLPYGGAMLEVDGRIKALNQLLPWHLKRTITDHLQALSVPSPPKDINLQSLAVDLEATNLERVRVYGDYLKALAMIGGVGSVGRSEGGQEQIAISSQYVIMSRLNGVSPGTLYIDDALRSDSLDVLRLGARLSKLWGRGTLLALSLHEFLEAKAVKDVGGMKRVRAYLAAELRDVGPGSDHFLDYLIRLQQFVDAELAAAGKP